MSTIETKDWLKRLASFVGIASAATLMTFPVLAQFYSPYSLFQPSVHRGLFESDDEEPSVTQVLEQDRVFEKFAQTLKQAGITEKLEQSGYVTILAPTNEAFDSWSAKQLLQPGNRAQLAQVMAYHIVRGAVPQEIVDRGSAEVITLEGSPVRINVNQYGEVRLNDARGLHPSTSASNGVIVRIDKVLMPPNTIANSTPSAIATRHFTIRNDTGQKVVKLYVESSGSRLWGMNEVGYTVLNNGQSITGKLMSDCLYDIKATLENGTELEYRQVDTCNHSSFSLAPQSNLELKTPVIAAHQAPHTSQASMPTSRGFYCDTSTGMPETRYRNTSGATEVWIAWNSHFFSNSGYNPLNRCQIVSQRLENYRRQGQLNYIGVGWMNGQNIICTAVNDGTCDGLIYTLKPHQNPERTLQQFLQHRQGVAGVQPLFESEDSGPLFVDVRPFIEMDASNSVSSPPGVNVIPQQQQPARGEAMRDL